MGTAVGSAGGGESYDVLVRVRAAPCELRHHHFLPKKLSLTHTSVHCQSATGHCAELQRTLWRLWVPGRCTVRRWELLSPLLGHGGTWETRRTATGTSTWESAPPRAGCTALVWVRLSFFR